MLAGWTVYPTSNTDSKGYLPDILMAELPSITNDTFNFLKAMFRSGKPLPNSNKHGRTGLRNNLVMDGCDPPLDIL